MDWRVWGSIPGPETFSGQGHETLMHCKGLDSLEDIKLNLRAQIVFGTELQDLNAFQWTGGCGAPSLGLENIQDRVLRLRCFSMDWRVVGSILRSGTYLGQDPETQMHFNGLEGVGLHPRVYNSFRTES